MSATVLSSLAPAVMRAPPGDLFLRVPGGHDDDQRNHQQSQDHFHHRLTQLHRLAGSPFPLIYKIPAPSVLAWRPKAPSRGTSGHCGGQPRQAGDKGCRKQGLPSAAISCRLFADPGLHAVAGTCGRDRRPGCIATRPSGRSADRPDGRRRRQRERSRSGMSGACGGRSAGRGQSPACPAVLPGGATRPSPHYRTSRPDDQSL
jgi:hypothetical protein